MIFLLDVATPKDSYDAGHRLGEAIGPYVVMVIILALIVVAIRRIRRR